MISKLIAMYEKGAITAHHLVVEVLNRLDPASLSLVLDQLPHDILERMLKYAIDFRPGMMRSNYPIQPAIDQVEAAKQWIEQRHGQARSNGFSNAECRVQSAE